MCVCFLGGEFIVLVESCLSTVYVCYLHSLMHELDDNNMI